MWHWDGVGAPGMQPYAMVCDGACDLGRAVTGHCYGGCHRAWRCIGRLFPPGLSDCSVERILEQTLAKGDIAIFHLEENPQDALEQVKLFAMIRDLVETMTMRSEGGRQGRFCGGQVFRFFFWEETKTSASMSSGRQRPTRPSAALQNSGNGRARRTNPSHHVSNFVANRRWLPSNRR